MMASKYIRLFVVSTVCIGIFVVFKMIFVTIPIVPFAKSTSSLEPTTPYHNNSVHWDGGHNTVSRYKLGKCQPVHQVVFLKVHKAGSSTIMNLIARFGFYNNLVFALPRSHNYVNRLAPLDTSVFLPPPPGRNYDLLCNHAVYNRTVFRSLFSNSTMYLGIVREPFHQFISAFRYYGVFRKVGGVQPVRQFLLNPDIYEFPKGLNFVQNRMIFDLGLDSKYFSDEDKVSEHIKMIAQDFDVILILEYFEESLVLLRRRFCWTIKDILSLPLNTNHRYFSYAYTFRDHDLHRNYSRADYALYRHFLKEFWRCVFEYGPDFFEEVTYFRSVIERVHLFCTKERLSLTKRTLNVPGSNWSSPFKVTTSDCKLIEMPEMQMMSLLRKAYVKQQK